MSKKPSVATKESQAADLQQETKNEPKVLDSISDVSLRLYTWGVKIKYDATTRTVIFEQWPWFQKELNYLTESLTKPNLCELYYSSGVTTIDLYKLELTPSILESLVKILKGNTQIKHVKFPQHYSVTDEYFARFCDGLEYYNFETLQLDSMKVTTQFRVLAEGLKLNQTITALELKNQWLKDGIMEEICNALKSSVSLTSFKLWLGIRELELSKREYKPLSELITINKLKHLTLSSNSILFEHLADALKTSTSIQSLELTARTMDFKLLGDILRANKSLTKLELHNTTMTEKSMAELDLSKNKNLVELSVIHCYGTNREKMTGATLFNALKSNTAIKSLTFTHSAKIDTVAIKEMLAVNETLTELAIPAIPAHASSGSECSNIAEGLRNNKTLRKLWVDMHYQEYSAKNNFIRYMNSNRNITHLNLGKLKKIGKNAYFIEEILQLVTENKTLRHVEGAEEYPLISEALKTNREMQDQIINNMCMLIRMIQRKPNSFILPMEVWSNIFKYTSYSFVPFDFEIFFKDSII